MEQAPRTVRPGGRTARTRAAVHAAVRALLAESGTAGVTVAAVAARANVHAATIYRRWRTPTALVLDTAIAGAAQRHPVAATGDLRADLLDYARALVADLRRPDGLALFRALVAAADDPDVGVRRAVELAAPRLEQFQRMLTASRTTELTAVDVFNLVLAPTYVAALLSAPAGLVEPEGLVDNVIAVRDHRRRR